MTSPPYIFLITHQVSTDDAEDTQQPKPGVKTEQVGAIASPEVLPTHLDTDDKWVDHARRHFSKFCVLVVEASMTQSQLQNALSDIALCKTRGGASGNFVITFDANLFGESITAPHVRRGPLQQPIITKMWKAVQAVRAVPDGQGLLPVGDVTIIIDGGRKNDSFLNHFGMGKETTTNHNYT